MSGTTGVTVTFARLARGGRRNADRGFAFYNTREGQNVFVHMKAARTLKGESDNLQLGDERQEVEYFPSQIVLVVGPGRKPGQFQADAWAPDPEPQKKRHEPPWYTYCPPIDQPDEYVGGQVTVRNMSTGRPWSGTTRLISFEIVGDVATLRLTGHQPIVDKWWNFCPRRDNLPAGRFPLELHGDAYLSFVFYTKRED